MSLASTLPNWISAAASVAVAVAAAIAAWQGIRSLSTWREETIGRRRMELAEDVIADFYEARDVLRWVRSPMGFGNESEGRPGRDDEEEDVRSHRDTFYVPLKRLIDHTEFFSRIQARRYRVIATFGKGAAKPYEELKVVHSRIAVAARILMKIPPGRVVDKTAFAREEKQEAVIWEGYGEPDIIAAEIDRIVEAAESRFRPEITKAVRA